MVLPATGIAIGLIVMLAMTIQDAAASIDSVHEQLEAANYILEQKQTRKDDLVESIAGLEKKLASAEAVLSRFTSALDSLDQQGEKINGDLEATVDNLVNGVELRSIGHTGQVLNINGGAPSEVEVLQYARNLDATGRFSEVTVANIRRVANSSEDMGGEGAEMPSSGNNSMASFALTLKLTGTE